MSEGIYKEKGSKFIGIAFPIKSEEGFKIKLEEIKQKYNDARHFCYALALGVDRNIYRQNDDGEPSGTAGKPIYGQILSFDLTNIAIIVIRYFGGTKLGVSGLINAYKAAAKDALENSEIIETEESFSITIQFDYSETNLIELAISKYNCSIISKTFDNICKYDLDCPISSKIEILESFSSKIL